MTPQLQQAIRLLQLSNLELGVFVETELERNPLLERDESRRGLPRREAAAPTTRRGNRTARRLEHGERPGARNGAATSAEATGQRVSRRPDRGRLGVAPATHPQRRRRRGRQPGGVRRRHALAGRSSDRAAAPDGHRPGRAADRRVSDPHGRRSRLPAGRAWTTWPTSWARRWRWWTKCWPSCRASTRRACSRATWRSAWRCSSRTPTATTRRSPGSSTTWPCSAATTSRRCGARSAWITTSWWR